MTGAQLVAHALARRGIKVVFGVVGIPVVEVAEACTEAGIRFVGFRHEQSAAMAASIWGYLARGIAPGVCLCVSGPGLVNALAGLFNAQANCWPMVLIGGSAEQENLGKGAFQELDQLRATAQYTKLSVQPAQTSHIPQTVDHALELAISGRPGAVYVDLPANFINHPTDVPQSAAFHDTAPLVSGTISHSANPADIATAASLLLHAKSPLLIAGKGASYAGAESQIADFAALTGIPFLPTPMAKGLLPDSHPQCVAAARSQALSKSDVIVLAGARLNWILHFGTRFRPDVKIIHIDIDPATASEGNFAGIVPLVGHLPLVLEHLSSATRDSSQQLSTLRSNASKYLAELRAIEVRNTASLNKKLQDQSLPMSYQGAYGVIRPLLPAGCVLVNEGARSMDIGRSIFGMEEPRLRLDASTNATMGVGLGYAIAAQLYHSHTDSNKKLSFTKRVVTIIGDSAFGFSAIEVETAARHGLPLVIIVVNNSGVYHGVAPASQYQQLADSGKLPSTALMPGTRYELFAEMVGGKGYLARDHAELDSAVRAAIQDTDHVSVINCVITPGEPNQKLEFAWMSSSSATPKTSSKL
ncbi:2-hydroxyacyl-CoA lyase 1 [Ramicandelaber brevisporus]|nr:2-hydroxyacyl-CoA lyase 1 [Ramicandelaber brevisporus]